MIEFYSIMIRIDQGRFLPFLSVFNFILYKISAGNNLMIALLLLQNWILMIEDSYATIDSRHVRLPAQRSSEMKHQFKCDLMHLDHVVSR